MEKVKNERKWDKGKERERKGGREGRKEEVDPRWWHQEHTVSDRQDSCDCRETNRPNCGP